MDIILASASPRRRELLKLITTDFKIMPADSTETLPQNISPIKAAQYLAVQKAEIIAAKCPHNLVIGCDTIVIIDNEILGKPHDEYDAERMLKLLSGKTHKVVTGCSLILDYRKFSFSEITEVEFYSLSDIEISTYITTKEPFDKAGAYGIQSKGSLLVKKINGDYFNVVGLPISRLKRELQKNFPDIL